MSNRFVVVTPVHITDYQGEEIFERIGDFHYRVGTIVRGDSGDAFDKDEEIVGTIPTGTIVEDVKHEPYNYDGSVRTTFILGGEQYVVFYHGTTNFVKIMTEDGALFAQIQAKELQIEYDRIRDVQEKIILLSSDINFG